jgi:acetyltransferase-like isoleucine patch superfamily enzyme
MGLFNRWIYKWRYPGVKVYNPSLTEIQKGAQVGEGSRVGSFTLIHKGARVGKHCTIGSHCNICPGVVIGDHVSVQTGCHITSGVTIGSGSFIGPGVVTMNDKFMDGHIQPPAIASNTRIGGGSAILPTVKIGSGVIVGSGSVVTSDVPDGQTVMGAPAKPRSPKSNQP